MLKAKGKEALITQPTRFVRIHTELGSEDTSRIKAEPPLKGDA